MRCRSSAFIIKITQRSLQHSHPLERQTSHADDKVQEFNRSTNEYEGKMESLILFYHLCKNKGISNVVLALG